MQLDFLGISGKNTKLHFYENDFVILYKAIATIWPTKFIPDFSGEIEVITSLKDTQEYS